MHVVTTSLPGSYVVSSAAPTAAPEEKAFITPGAPAPEGVAGERLPAQKQRHGAGTWH